METVHAKKNLRTLADDRNLVAREQLDSNGPSQTSDTVHVLCAALSWRDQIQRQLQCLFIEPIFDGIANVNVIVEVPQPVRGLFAAHYLVLNPPVNKNPGKHYE